VLVVSCLDACLHVDSAYMLTHTALDRYAFTLFSPFSYLVTHRQEFQVVSEGVVSVLHGLPLHLLATLVITTGWTTTARGG